MFPLAITLIAVRDLGDRPDAKLGGKIELIAKGGIDLTMEAKLSNLTCVPRYSRAVIAGLVKSPNGSLEKVELLSVRNQFQCYRQFHALI